MDKAVIYIHGKGGNAEEAIHYKPLFSNCDVIGLDYTAQFPWEAKEEFPLLFNSIYRNYKTVEVIANSIGAYFAINALSNQQIEKAYFISPVVDMERLGSTENGGRESGNRSDGSCVTHDSSTAERYAFRWNEPRQRYGTAGIK